MKIKDYWCYGCGLVANTSFSCPVCGSIIYGLFDVDTSELSNPEHIMKLYKAGTLYVHCEDGQLVFREGSVGPVNSGKNVASIDGS